MSAEGLERRRSTALRTFLVFLAAVVLGYSLLIATQPLLGVLLVLLLYFAYLTWQFLGLARRFVGALERIADSMQGGEESFGSRADAGEIEREREF